MLIISPGLDAREQLEVKGEKAAVNSHEPPVDRVAARHSTAKLFRIPKYSTSLKSLALLAKNTPKTGNW
jgi:hypothetical protein